MTEEDLLLGITDALNVGGWRWHHIRRSDHAIQMGAPGWPDIFAIHRSRGETFVAELKSDTGRLEPGQAEWLDDFAVRGIEARVIRPAQYEPTWRHLVGDRLIERRTA